MVFLLTDSRYPRTTYTFLECLFDSLPQLFQVAFIYFFYHLLIAIDRIGIVPLTPNAYCRTYFKLVCRSKIISALFP